MVYLSDTGLSAGSDDSTSQYHIVPVEGSGLSASNGSQRVVQVDVQVLKK